QTTEGLCVGATENQRGAEAQRHNSTTLHLQLLKKHGGGKHNARPLAPGPENRIECAARGPIAPIGLVACGGWGGEHAFYSSSAIVPAAGEPSPISTRFVFFLKYGVREAGCDECDGSASTMGVAREATRKRAPKKRGYR